MANVKVQWSFSGDIECPYCDHIDEFTDSHDWFEFAEIGENKNFDEPILWLCSECGSELKITGTVY